MDALMHGRLTHVVAVVGVVGLLGAAVLAGSQAAAAGASQLPTLAVSFNQDGSISVALEDDTLAGSQRDLRIPSSKGGGRRPASLHDTRPPPSSSNPDPKATAPSPDAPNGSDDELIGSIGSAGACSLALVGLPVDAVAAAA
jgi:hypothetical protein